MFTIFFLVGFFSLVGILLAVFITRKSPPGNEPMVPPEDDFRNEPEESKKITLPLEGLFRLAEKMCEENKLTIREKSTTREREMYWICESDNPFFYGVYVMAFF